MHIAIIWRTWGLPFGFSVGAADSNKDWKWAFTVGPFHLIKHI